MLYSAYTRLHLILLWVETESDILFMEAANHPEVLRGFPRIAELYAAHLDPGGDHSELVAEALQYLPKTPTDVGLQTADSLLVPLGRNEIHWLGSQLWSDLFRRFRQTDAFRQIMRDAGVLAYWREHGFPPLCRAVGADGFECD